MKKTAKIFCTFLVILAVFWLLGVISDRKELGESLIRLHVVASSDSQEDQKVKLMVRDAIIDYIAPEIIGCSSMQEAKTLLGSRLEELEEVANETLAAAGFEEKARVTLEQEAFPVRHYETFALPSGVYQSLRVTIGEGSGKNWWCVVFPSLCLPAVGEDFADTAAGAGFDRALTGALEGESGYEVRFYLLDWLGKVENFFWQFGK